MRRRIMTTALLATATFPLGGALVSASAPPTEPPADSPEGSMAVAPDSAAVDVFDDSGEVVATITVGAVEAPWADYAEGEEPDAGNDYVRVLVTISSLVTDGSYEVSIDDFELQSAHGFMTEAENIKTAAQAEADEDVPGEADLANGESVEYALTFQVTSSVGPDSVFYAPDDDRLIDVVDLG